MPIHPNVNLMILAEMGFMSYSILQTADYAFQKDLAAKGIAH